MLTLASKTRYVGVSRGMALVLVPAVAIQQAVAADRGQSAPQAANVSAKGGDLEEVVVSGHYEFLSVDTSGATNLPLPIEKVPQSISLVSEDFIKAADLKTLGDIAEYTPGALKAGNQEGFGTIIKLRGFASAQSIDGLNVGGLAGTSYEPDYAIIDSWRSSKGLRLSFDVSHASTVVYGGANWSGIDSLTAYLHGGYERHVRTSFDGVPTQVDGSPAPLPRSFLIGSKDMELRTSVYHAEGDLTWHGVIAPKRMR